MYVSKWKFGLFAKSARASAYNFTYSSDTQDVV